jgi:cytochrome P450
MDQTITDYDAIDFFRGEALVADPYPYFEWLRNQCPVQREPQYGVYMVTGYDEAFTVYADADTFSSCNSVTGPFPGFPVALEGRDDASELIEQHRDKLPFSDQILTMDPPKHRDHRHLLMRQLTPKRLKENEEYVWRLADRQIDQFIQRRQLEFVGDYANPFTLLVIADLLGVPEEEHDEFRAALARRPGHDAVGSTKDTMSQSPLAWLYDRFSRYIEDRRREPQDDVLTALATTTFPNGDLPEVIDVARVAANVFAAGQETTVRLLGTALQLIGERPDLQGLLRQQRGATLMVLNGAANRDPRHFPNAAEFQIARSNARDHLAFGRGPHSCPGGSLARLEARVTIDRLLDRTAEISISEEHHGPPDARRYTYVPTYILRGLTRLYLDFIPAGTESG